MKKIGMLNVRAAIGQTGQRWGQASRSVSGGTEYTWSDHQKEHGGHATKRVLAVTDETAGTTTYFAEFSVGGTTVLFR